jgi:hypothetical protein
MNEQRKAKDRARKQHQRQRKPRQDYLADNSLSRTKPWQADGISRATWFRRRETKTHQEQESHRETGLSEVKLSYTEDTLVSLRKPESQKVIAEEALGLRKAARESMRLSSHQVASSPDTPVSRDTASSPHILVQSPVSSAHVPVSRGDLLQVDEVFAHDDPRGICVANGFAISHSPEDRKPEPSCRVWMREIRHPAIKSGPDDDLADLKISARL